GRLLQHLELDVIDIEPGVGALELLRRDPFRLADARPVTLDPRRVSIALVLRLKLHGDHPMLPGERSRLNAVSSSSSGAGAAACEDCQRRPWRRWRPPAPARPRLPRPEQVEARSAAPRAAARASRSWS